MALGIENIFMIALLSQLASFGLRSVCLRSLCHGQLSLDPVIELQLNIRGYKKQTFI